MLNKSIFLLFLIAAPSVLAQTFRCDYTMGGEKKEATVTVDPGKGWKISESAYWRDDVVGSAPGRGFYFHVLENIDRFTGNYRRTYMSPGKIEEGKGVCHPVDIKKRKF